MTKLEKKLIELGYIKSSIFFVNENRTVVGYENCKWACLYVEITFFKETNKIHTARLNLYDKEITHYSQVEEIQQAFNELQRDLEELKLCQ